MSAAEKLAPLPSPEEYLASEILSEVRREYVAGDIRAMAGGTLAHNQIAGNVYANLQRQLQGKRCRPYIADVKVRISLGSDDSAFYYPDVVVDCGQQPPKALVCESPTVIFEILSPGTERIDRREKYLAYLMLPTLQFYVLAEQDRRAVTVFRREKDGFRQDILQESTSILEFPDIGCSLMLSEIYEGVEI